MKNRARREEFPSLYPPYLAKKMILQADTPHCLQRGNKPKQIKNPSHTRNHSHTKRYVLLEQLFGTVYKMAY